MKIYRDDALDVINKVQSLGEARSLIGALDSADDDGSDWIVGANGLPPRPSESGWYLVTYVNFQGERDVDLAWFSNRWLYAHKILAFKPKPEPWNG